MENEGIKSEKGAEEGAKAASGAGRKPRRPAPRRLVQLYAALLYNANIKGFVDGHIYSGPLKSVCVPGFNCYSCPGAIASCPLGSLQNALNASGHTAPWYMLGMLSLFGVVLGRTICGWICPLGLIQELLHKLPLPKVRKSLVTRRLTYLKYVFLLVFAVFIPIWYGLNKGIPFPGFCKFICPAGTLEGAVGLLQNKANATSFYQLKILFTRKWVIMLAVFLACAFCYRSFCRFICPLGAIYGLFNRFSLTGVKVDMDRCVSCGLCVRQCRMDVRHVGDHECISCGCCMEACPKGAISLKAGRFTLAGPACGKNDGAKADMDKRRRTGRIAWGAAVLVLIFVLFWFNRDWPAGGTGRSSKSEAVAPGSPGSEGGNAGIVLEKTGSGNEKAAADADAAGRNGQDAGREQAIAGKADAGAAEADTADSEGRDAGREPAAAEESDAGAAGADAADRKGKEPGAEADAGKESAVEEMAAAGRIGTGTGDILPDFRTELLGGGEFHLADYRGQVVIINLWATTCAPCIEELPYYERLKEAHPDVEILAIHHRAGAKKAEAFLADKGWDQLDFALDSKEKGLFALLEAADAMPQTIILNKKGEVIYNVQAPLTYEQLEALIK